MLHPRNQDTNRYPLFEELISEFSLKNTLLDFGGNQGNLLYFSNGKILENNYTSLDISAEAIATGKGAFPNSRFIFWNRYNEMYNHTGNKNEPLPELPPAFDYIWAYSVFSHMIFEDILECLLWMKNLQPKKAYLSYLCNDQDINSQKVLQYFYDRRKDKFGSTVDFRYNTENYFYLTNNRYGVESGETFIAVYNTNWLINKLYENGIIVKKVESSKFPVPFLELSNENFY
jgi:hypothetical protein